jgi:hypothetical protein
MKPKERKGFKDPVTNVPWGLCGNREDHEPHLAIGSPVGDFFCTARQEDRLPYAAEERRGRNKL